MQENRFTMVPNWIMYDLDGLTVYEFAVLTALCSYMWGTKTTANPSIATLAKTARCSRRSVSRALDGLREKGVITWVPKGDRKPNEYRLLDPSTSAPQAYVSQANAPQAQALVPDRHMTSAPQAHETYKEQDNYKKTITPYSPPPRQERFSDAFELAWRDYPIEGRRDKRDAWNEWKRATSRATVSEIAQGIRNYRDDPNRDPAYTRTFTRWLKADAWENPPLPPRHQPRSKQAQSDAHWNTLMAQAIAYDQQRTHQPQHQAVIEGPKP